MALLASINWQENPLISTALYRPSITDSENAPWVGGLTDETRIGLPKEFAMPVLDAIKEFCSNTNPPEGSLVLTGSAFSPVGSSAMMFNHLARVALEIMVRPKLDENVRNHFKLRG